MGIIDLVEYVFECAEHGFVFKHVAPQNAFVHWDDGGPICPKCKSKWKLTVSQKTELS